MRCVTYNIQYGIGMDGVYDLERIAQAVRGADLIALQEVSRNYPQNGGADLVAGLKQLFPEYFSVFGSPFKVDLGSALSQGIARSNHFEFGNMILSKAPILSSRNLLLPRSRTHNVLNLQRSALEAMVETPAGPVRFYSVHLDHTSEMERLMQIEWLKARVVNFPLEGGAVTGVSSMGFPEPPHPEHALLMGDFNLVPESESYVALCGVVDEEYGRQVNSRFFADVSIPSGEEAANSHSWYDPEGIKPPKRLDYCFASASLADHIGSARVDRDAPGSDHRPVWIEIR